MNIIQTKNKSFKNITNKIEKKYLSLKQNFKSSDDFKKENQTIIEKNHQILKDIKNLKKSCEEIKVSSLKFEERTKIPKAFLWS